MIIVSEQAKDFFSGVRHPEDKVVRLDLARHTALDDRSGERQVRVAVGESRKDDQVVLRDGEEVLRISHAVSEAFDGGVLKPLETSQGLGFCIAPPEAGQDAAS